MTEIDPQATNRDAIRAAVFSSNNNIATKLLDVYGTQIELRPPTLESLLDAQDVESTKLRVAQMIIEYSYVPGTNVLVFEEADTDAILELRFGEDLRKMQAAITELTGVDLEKAKKEIQSPLGETS